MSHFTLEENKNLQFIDTLQSFKEHLKLVNVYIHNERDEFKAFNFLSMSYSDYNHMKLLYYNFMLYSETTEKLFATYLKFKKEAEFIMTCSGRKDYSDLDPLKNACIEIVKEVETIYQKK